MIRYQLQCAQAHQFEGWFSNSAAFDEQAEAGRIDCPVCGSTEVAKALMAPNISARTRAKGLDRRPAAGREGRPADSGHEGASGKGNRQAPAAIVADDTDGAPHDDSVRATTEPVLAQGEIVELMRKIRKEVESKAENVGKQFAEEARKIHYQESEPRGIYGEATRQEVEELSDEGVEFYPLPTLPEDSN